jgi:hypothetical protein
MYAPTSLSLPKSGPITVDDPGDPGDPGDPSDPSDRGDLTDFDGTEKVLRILGRGAGRV